MGIQINGSSDIISAADGSLTISGADLTSLTQVAVSGVSTFSQVSFGSTINVRIGDTNTGCSLTSGTNNNFLGASAGRNTTAGAHNNFLGRCAGFANTTGSFNNFFGLDAGCCNTTGNGNNFLGNTAGRANTTGNFNNFFGNSAGRVNTTGCYNNFFGLQAGRYNTTGRSNNFFGFNAGFCNTTGCHNNFFGEYAGFRNTTGCHNNFIGNAAGFANTTGSHNIFFGLYTGKCNTIGCNNNFFGKYAGCSNTTGCHNNFFGRDAGCVNTTGCDNNFFGNSAGRCNTTGCFNNFFGLAAGCCNTTGGCNNFFGNYAGGKTTTGSCNTFLGRYAGCNNTTGSHNIAIGNGAQLASATASCQLVISAGGVDFLRGDSSGRLLIGTSSSASAGDSQYAKLQVKGNTFSATGNGILSLQSGTTNPSSGNALGTILFADNVGGEFGRIDCFVDGTSGTNDYPSRLTFSTTADGASTPTERMRIGNNGVITTTASASDVFGFVINTNSGNQYNLHLVKSADQNTINEDYLRGSGGGTVRFKFVGNGGLYNYSANNTNLSDINTKKDISPAADTWDCIKEWEIVNYRYKNQPDDADLNLGVIAQQVSESCPEVITVFSEATEDEPEKLGIKEQQMYWMAIKALQEAQVRIEALEAEVAALKAQ